MRIAIFFCFTCFIIMFRIEITFAHGRLVDPPARGTMWRLGFSTPPNYNDHELFCGGYARQWEMNKGRCGECGDPWDLPRPRPNESGGTFGTGIISRAYRQADEITITVHLTANHLGWFEFRLCQNNKLRQYVKQSCLNKNVLKLSDHRGTRYDVKIPEQGLFRIRVKLPEKVVCTNCVLQWHYTTGNNWGECPRGADMIGCGPQEVFRGCSDIAIFSLDDDRYLAFQNLTRVIDYSNINEKTGKYKTYEESERDKEKQKKELENMEDNEIKGKENDKYRFRKLPKAKVFSYYNRYDNKNLANATQSKYVSSSSFRKSLKNEVELEKIREFLKNLPLSDMKPENLQHLLNKPRLQVESDESTEVVSKEISSLSAQSGKILLKITRIMALLLELNASSPSVYETEKTLDHITETLSLTIHKNINTKVKTKTGKNSVSKVRTNTLRRERKEYYSRRQFEKSENENSEPKKLPVYVSPNSLIQILSQNANKAPNPSRRQDQSEISKSLENFGRKRNQISHKRTSSEELEYLSLRELRTILKANNDLEQNHKRRNKISEDNNRISKINSLLKFLKSKQSSEVLDSQSSEESSFLHLLNRT